MTDVGQNPSKGPAVGNVCPARGPEEAGAGVAGGAAGLRQALRGASGVACPPSPGPAGMVRALGGEESWVPPAPCPKPVASVFPPEMWAPPGLGLLPPPSGHGEMLVLSVLSVAPCHSDNRLPLSVAQPAVHGVGVAPAGQHVHTCSQTPKQGALPGAWAGHVHIPHRVPDAGGAGAEGQTLPLPRFPLCEGSPAHP